MAEKLEILTATKGVLPPFTVDRVVEREEFIWRFGREGISISPNGAHGSRFCSSIEKIEQFLWIDTDMPSLDSDQYAVSGDMVGPEAVELARMLISGSNAYAFRPGFTRGSGQPRSYAFSDTHPGEPYQTLRTVRLRIRGNEQALR